MGSKDNMSKIEIFDIFIFFGRIFSQKEITKALKNIMIHQNYDSENYNV
jgi:hypothetical protein